MQILQSKTANQAKKEKKESTRDGGIKRNVAATATREEDNRLGGEAPTNQARVQSRSQAHVSISKSTAIRTHAFPFPIKLLTFPMSDSTIAIWGVVFLNCH